MLKTRVLTAVVLVAWVFYALSFAPEFVSGIPVRDLMILTLFSIFVLLAGAEYLALRWHAIDGFNETEFPRPPMRREFLGIGSAYALVVPMTYMGETWFHFTQAQALSAIFVWVALVTVFLAAWFYRREVDLEVGTQKLLNTLAGFVYFSLPAEVLFQLGRMPIEGAPRGIALYFAMSVVFLGDTGAYFTGRTLSARFKTHKLIPRVSPKKTVEGAIGGLVFSGAAAIFIAHTWNIPVAWWLAGLTGVMAGAAGQVGDLVESAVKRAANCKDSGNLLPGHGGMFDRIDALLFGGPICFALFLLAQVFA